MVQRSPLGERLGRERMFFTVAHAVERYLGSRRPRAGAELRPPCGSPSATSIPSIG